jgi:hypothetical protein
MRRSWFMGLCLLLVLLRSAHGAPLLSQPLVFVDGRASHVTNGTGFITYDRIQLAQTSLIDSVTWIGAFIDTSTPANNPVPLQATTWNFQVLGDALGNPGSLIDSTSMASASVASTLLGSATLAGQSVNVYSFTASLADPLLIAGGADQWFTVYSENGNADPRFAWLSGSGGDGVSQQQSLANHTFTTYGDRALTLAGQAVPEPATLPLLLLAFSGLVVATRRSR